MLTVITGPMFSGKTAELIRRINRDRIGGKTVQVFKYKADARYAGEGSIASYDGWTHSALPTSTTEDIVAQLSLESDVVVIDEVQFYDAAVVDLAMSLVEMRKEVICGGLNLDFRAEPFSFQGSSRTIAELMARADKVVKLSAVCTYMNGDKPCGASATRTQRMVDGAPAHFDSPVVLIGSSEHYEARCVAHHVVPGRPSLFMFKKVEYITSV